MSETPHVDAAVRAGCSPWHDEDCTYPACDCAPVVPDMIKTALRAALTPSAETIRAMAREHCFHGGCGVLEGQCKKHGRCTVDPDESEIAQMLSAYHAIPIVRELWPELANAEDVDG